MNVEQVRAKIRLSPHPQTASLSGEEIALLPAVDQELIRAARAKRKRRAERRARMA